jgi:hypothetical protein
MGFDNMSQSCWMFLWCQAKFEKYCNFTNLSQIIFHKRHFGAEFEKYFALL